MADVESNLNLNIDTSDALANIRALQREISRFNTEMAKSGQLANTQLAQMQQNLVNSINKTGNFSATIQRTKTTTESFTNALEKNKFSMGEYFRYAAASSKTFGRAFKTEFDTINKVARERVKDLQTQYIKLGRDASGAMQSIAIRPLALDMDNFATKAAIAAQKQQLFNQLVSQGSTNLLNFGKNTQWAGRQLMVGFTIPLSIMGSTAAREFMKIEEQTIRLQRVYGDFSTTIQESDAMVDSVKKLASEFTKYGVAVEKTLGLAADAAAMGKTGQALLDQVTEATRLAVLGGVEQQQALETTISLTNAFGIANEQLSGKINFLNAVENQTVTSIEDLTEAIPKAGPVIQQLGGDVEDLAFFMTAMKEGGINASEGANALKSGLASLINPTNEASEMLAGFGINIQDIVNRNAGNVSGIVIEFAKALETLDPLNKAQAIEQLFGKFQFARMSTLFQNVIAQGTQAERVLQLSQSTSQELAVLAERELARVSESPMYKFQKAWEDMKAALAPVGEEFLKAVTPLIDFGTQILNKFNEMSEGSKQFVVILTTAVAGIGPILLMTFGLIANGVANIIKGFLALNNFFKRVGTQSTTLGHQTEYMTQQQLEAAAVAASLGQVHSSLTQTFTAEAGAVRGLVAAYDAAIARQRAFTGPVVGGMGRGAKKYASGVVSVPGPKGAGDIIPAMLSPGEAVIPAEMAQRYAGLIDGMIAGNIPGYQYGVSQASTSGIIASHGNAPKYLSAEEARAFAETNMQPGSRAYENYINAQSGRNTYSNLVFGMPASFNTGQMTGTDAARWIKEQPGAFGSYLQSLEGIDANSPGMREFGDHLAKQLAKAGTNAIDDPAFYAAVDSAIEKTKDQETKKALIKARESYRSGEIVNSNGKSRREAFAGMGPSYINRRDPIRARYNAVADEFETGTTQEAKKQATRVTRSRKAAADEVVKTQATTAAYARSQAKAEKMWNDQYEQANRTERAKLTRNKEAWIAEQTVMLEDERKAARRAREAAKREQQQKKPSLGSRLGGAARGAAGAVARGFTPGRMAGVGMALSGATMLGGMIPGPAGEAMSAMSGPLAAVSGIAMAMSMIPGPAGLVIGALGGLGLVIGTLNAEAEAARKAATDLAVSVGTSAKTMNEMAKAAGTVSPIESANQLRRQSAFKPKDQNEFGTAFLQQDAGKQMLNAAKQSIDKVGVSGAADQIGLQLSSAIATGTITAFQAGDIVAALSEELNSTSFGLSVTAKIDKLTGKGGEDVTKNPVAVAVAISNESKKKLDAQLNQVMEDVKQKTDAVESMTAWKGGVSTASQAVNLMEFQKAAPDIVSGFNGMRTNLQASVDLLDTQYDKVIQQLYAEGKIEEAKAKQLEYDKQRQELLNQTRISTDSLISKLSKVDQAGRDTMVRESAAQAKALYAGTEQESAANKALDQLAGGKASAEAKVVLSADVAAGVLSPEELQGMLDLFKNDSKSINLIGNISAEVGAAGSQQMSELLNLFTGDAEKAGKFVAQIEDMDPETTDKVLNTLDTIRNVAGDDVAKIAVEMVGTKEGIEKLSQLQSQYDEINALAAKGPIKLEQITSIDSNGMAALKSNQAWFDSLPAVQQKFFLDHFVTVYATIDDSEIDSYMRQKGIKGAGSTTETKNVRGKLVRETVGGVYTDQQRSQYKAEAAAYEVKKLTDSMASLGLFNDSGASGPRTPTDTGGGGGGGATQPEKPPTSMLDDLVKKLRDVRANVIGLTDTWDTSWATINSLFGSGANMNLFAGLEQQMRSLGAGEELVSLVTGMSKEEWEQRKGDLFNFDSGGRITGFKDMLSSIGRALNAIRLGEFQSQQAKSVQAAQDQNTAIRKLVASGMSYAEAFKVAEDTALAHAIAQETNVGVINQLITSANAATVALANMSAAQSVANTNLDATEMSKVVSFLEQYSGALTDAQTEAILASDDLQQLVSNFNNLTPEQLTVLNQALANADLQASVELNVKKLTIDGMESIFQTGFSNAMEAFSAQEKAIDLRFNIEKGPFEDVIKAAQDRIEDLRNAPGGLDDLEADLQRIGEQEQDINKAYDDKLNALTKIEQANNRIAAQQRSQLSLAEALSQGDIAAAARAAQDMRAESANQAIIDQREALQAARDLEISRLMGQMGLTREQIEAQIRDIKVQIFEIEEQQIEPAQRRIDLLVRQEELEKENLRVAGLTREEWEKIRNGIELAKTSSESYIDAIAQALTIVDNITSYWDDLDGREVSTIHNVITRQITENTPAPAPAAPAPAPPAPAPTPSFREYTIVRGDTLWGIASRFLGAGNRYMEIFNNSSFRSGDPNLIYPGEVARIPMATGGLVPSLAGKFAIGTDTVPTMLTPGEFVVKKYAVDNFGVENLKAINDGSYNSGSVYNSNYSINVNVKSEANPDQIARTVATQIKNIDAQRIRGNRF